MQVYLYCNYFYYYYTTAAAAVTVVVSSSSGSIVPLVYKIRTMVIGISVYK